jgi:hypothetical protein
MEKENNDKVVHIVDVRQAKSTHFVELSSSPSLPFRFM